VVATALGVVVLDEQLAAAGALGAALILLGLLVQGRGASGAVAAPSAAPGAP